jgi:hypothetical protein
MEESQQSKPKDAGTVGPNAVLNQGRLFSLHPGMKSCEVQDGEENDPCKRELNDQHFHHGAVAPAALAVVTSTPYAANVSQRTIEGANTLAIPREISSGKPCFVNPTSASRLVTRNRGFRA